jgi:hypothetical protein
VLVRAALRAWAAGGEVPPPPTAASLLVDELRAMRSVFEGRRHATVVVDELPSSEAGRTLFGRLRDELWELPVT